MQRLQFSKLRINMSRKQKDREIEGYAKHVKMELNVTDNEGIEESDRKKPA